MSLDALIMLVGVLVTLLPFLGLPLKWDNIVLVVLGVFVIALGIIVRRRGLKYPSAIHKGNGTYVESTPREMAEPISRGTPAESDA
ncbi:MAG: hypothetical protein AAB908_00510 [Patescibacteria group bacterium]